MFERHPKKTLAAFYLLLLLICESLVRVLAYYGQVPIVHYPTTSIVKRFLTYDNEHFGVWHNPGSYARHHTPCFDVEYSANSYGARDKERGRASNAEKRIVVFGDSFVEGTGIELKSRFTELAELKTGVEHLNFGTSGDFSSTQEWLLYRELASKFDHTDVFVFLLPANDFADNDPSNFPSDRYRPYLRRAADSSDYERYYTVEYENRSGTTDIGRGRKIRRHLYNNIYLLNLICQAPGILSGKKAPKRYLKKPESGSDSHYDDFNAKDLGKLLFGYRKIVELAAGKNVVIFIIPRHVDFIAHLEGKNQRRVVRALESFAAEYEQLRVVDLLPEFLQIAQKKGLSYHDFFHTCDGHWSPLGHEAAAQVISRY